MLSFYVRYNPSALFFSGEHDKMISFAGGLIKRKYLQSTSISDADGSENRKGLRRPDFPAPVQVMMIDRLSDLIADRRIVETGHERDKSMSLGIKTSINKKHKSKYSDTTVSSRGHREVKPTPRGA